MTAHTTVLTLTSADDEVPATARFSLDKGLAVRELADHLTALSAGLRTGTVAVLTDNGSAARASGTVALSGVGGTAASNTVTLGGSAGDLTIVTDGTSVGPVAYNTSDAQTALNAITALNNNATFAAKATASSGGSGVITITWDTKGTVGNSKTLTASRTAGTATVGGNGTTLGGGAQGSVGVTIGGTTVTTDTTNLTDAAATTAVAATITANSTVNKWVTASGASTTVTIRAILYGLIGNSISLTATSATGTATASGGRLTGGTADTSAVTVTF